MKKIWKYAILLVALSALLCMSAFAADELTVNNIDGTATINDNKESFAVSYEAGADNAGGQYLIIMLAGTETGSMPDPTKTKILYVNQDAAGEDGVVKFDNVYPTTVEDSVIWLTGGANAVVLASVKAPVEPQPTGVTVSGTAASWNSTDDAVYLLYADTVDDATIKAEWKDGTYATAGNVVYTGTKGTIAAATVETKSMQAQSFSFAGVANGTYKLAIFKPGKYVPKIVTVTVSGSDVDMGTQKLWLYGDVTYDGKITSMHDVLNINRYIAGLSSIFDQGDDVTKAERFAAANVTAIAAADNVVNSMGDVLNINRYIAGLTSVFDAVK